MWVNAITAAASKKRERERETGIVKKYELNSADYRINLISTCFDQKWIVYYFGEKKRSEKIENQ